MIVTTAIAFTILFVISGVVNFYQKVKFHQEMDELTNKPHPFKQLKEKELSLIQKNR